MGPNRRGHFAKWLVRFIPNSTLSLLGQILAALSLFTLVSNATNFGLSHTFSVVLSVYMHFIDITLGKFDPVVITIIAFIKRHIQIGIIFNPGWRHLFVILQILFVRDAATAFADGRRSLAYTRLVVGFVIATLFSILLWAPFFVASLVANIAFSLIPVTALLVYDIVIYIIMSLFFFHQVDRGEMVELTSRSDFFATGVFRSFLRFAIVGIPSIAVFLYPPIRLLPYPAGGIVGIIAGVAFNAAYWLIHASLYAHRQSRAGEDFWSAFNESEAGRFGVALTKVVFWFFVFCVLNAGGRIINL